MSRINLYNAKKKYNTSEKLIITQKEVIKLRYIKLAEDYLNNLLNINKNKEAKYIYCKRHGISTNSLNNALKHMHAIPNRKRDQLGSKKTIRDQMESNQDNIISTTNEDKTKKLKKLLKGGKDTAYDYLARNEIESL